MKVLFVIHYPVIGGPHIQALRLKSQLSNYGWEMIVLLPDETGKAAELLTEGGVEVVQMPLHRFRATLNLLIHAKFALCFWPEVLAIRRLLRERSIKLVVIGGLVNPHAAIAARLEGVPVVWQILDTRTPPLLRAALMPLVRRWSDAVMFNGKGLIKQHGGQQLLRCPSFVWCLPVPTNCFRPSLLSKEEIRKGLGLPPKGRFVGTVANLNPQKGIEYFIRSAAIIYRSIPDSYFLIVGSYYYTHRKYTTQLESEVMRSGVPRERFIFTGWRPDVEKYYPAMDIKLITSVPRSEGTTTTALEAMAFELPVVATDVGAVCEVVEHGVTGLVVPPLNPQAIAEATLNLLGNPSLSYRMGQEGRRRVVERYDTSVCGKIHLEAFEAALLNHKRKRRNLILNRL